MFSRRVAAALSAPRPSRGLLLLSCCGLSFAHRLGQSVRRPPTPRLAAVFSTLSTNPSSDLALPCRNLAFYLIGEVAEPDEAVRRHRKFLDESSMVGRVYICGSGVNAQVSGTAAACSAYRRFVTAEFPDDPPLFKEDPVAEPTFPKLRVKHKALVPAVDAAVDLTQRGEDLEPEAWAEMLARTQDSTKPRPVMLDVRNQYEYDVGHFDGAVRPQGVAQFSESDAASFGLDPNNATAKEETEVMMYCTGGIRCEYFSAALKAQGWKKVYKLKGGVQHYGNTLGSEGVPHWKGSLFVFDRRNTVPLGDGGAEVVGKCHHCGAPTESFVNCCNVDCNRLHLVCGPCFGEHEGFCQPSCAAAPRRRLLSLALGAEADAEGGARQPLDLETVLATTQGPAPNAPDVNKLSTIMGLGLKPDLKPAGVPRNEFDADKHMLRPKRDGEADVEGE